MHRDPLRPPRTPRTFLHAATFVVALLIAALGTATAQLASGAEPGQVADEAVRAWLEQEPPTVAALTEMTPEEVCQQLPVLLTNPPPPEGTQVTFGDRRELDAPSEDQRRFTYGAELPDGQLEVVQVDVRQENGTWVATSVGFRTPDRGPRPWLANPLVWALFMLVSLAVLVLLLRRDTFLRSWLGDGGRLLRRHRSLFIGTMVLVYGAFALGALAGSALPDACADAVETVLSEALESAGATQAVASGNLLRTAVAIFYQNFVVVNIFLFFTLALLFGLPAYLMAAFVLFVNGVPFGLLGTVGPLELLFVAILLFLELTAHALVVTGGGMLLGTVVREGLGGYSEGLRRLALMVPLAFLLLLIGAWYESFLIVPIG